MRRPAAPKSRGATSAFTLVELLVVASIMAIMMGLLAVSLTQSQGRALQMASAQVASGMGLARQLAITKNTDARFIIAPRRGGGAGSFYPEEPFRYWAVVQSNRGANTWTLAKDWEALPGGTVFLNIACNGYRTINWLPVPLKPGTPYDVTIASNTSAPWDHFCSFADMRITWPGGSTNATRVPYIGFKPTGKAAAANLGLARETAVGLGEGVVTPDNKIILKSTNNITRVETDINIGKITVRPRDSYR
jgi:type II secretory pathway pseudopilin PulG